MSDETPFFSVILPTYNRAAMLRAAIKSVLAQTCREYECFVLDDGSTDATPEVFHEFAGEKSLRLIRFEDNRRQHARRNHALRLARGQFATFIDSDDLWLPERLEVFQSSIQARPETGFWFSNSYILRDGRIVGTAFDPRRLIPEGRVPGWWAVGDRYLPYLTTNLAVRRAAFERIGYFREDMEILEDTELYARMLNSGIPVGAIREPLAVRRLHEGQITMRHQKAYGESLAALVSGGAPEKEFLAQKRRLALKTGSFMIKSFAPGESRIFLKSEIGSRRFLSLTYWMSFIPVPILRIAKAAHSAWLRCRCAFFAPPDFHKALDRVTPFLKSVEP